MFECRLAQASLIKKIMEAICPVVDEINLECTSSGLQIQAMDTANVCMVQLELSHEGFDPYRCDKNIMLGIKLSDFLKIIRCGGSDSSISLKCQDNSDSLSIIITEEGGDRTASFKQKLMDLDAEHLALDDKSCDATVKMASHKFQRIVRELSQFNDTIVVKCTKEGVEFGTPNDAVSQEAKIFYQTSASVDSKDELSMEVNEPVTVSYASRYVGIITKATPLSDTVSLSMGSDHPFRVEYNIGDFGKLSYYLAPKTNTEMDDDNMS